MTRFKKARGTDIPRDRCSVPYALSTAIICSNFFPLLFLPVVLRYDAGSFVRRRSFRAETSSSYELCSLVP